MKRSELTPRQEQFVQEYLIDLNGAAAYSRAGYAARGNSAEAAASRLLRNVKVRARVREAQAARAARVEIRQDAVLAELLLILHSDVRHYAVEAGGKLVVLDGVPQEVGRAVSGVKWKTKRYMEGGPDGKEVEVEEIEIKLWDKDSAIEKAGRHLGLFPAKLTIDDPDEVLQRLLGVGKAELPKGEK